MDSRHDDNIEDLQPEAEETTTAEELTGSETEADVLRFELERAQEKIGVLRDSVADFKDKFMRSRAELDNYRRRSLADLDRARASGMDSAVAPVLRVFDDLGRAIAAAEGAAESSREAIVDGLRLVVENLEKELDQLGVERYGSDGDDFDPEIHEAVTAIPPQDESQAGKVAHIVQAGFRQGERTIRVAKVVVYSE